jgi:hypothetical protein
MRPEFSVAALITRGGGEPLSVTPPAVICRQTRSAFRVPAGRAMFGTTFPFTPCREEFDAIFSTNLFGKGSNPNSLYPFYCDLLWPAPVSFRTELSPGGMTSYNPSKNPVRASQGRSSQRLLTKGDEKCGLKRSIRAVDLSERSACNCGGQVGNGNGMVHFRQVKAAPDLW